VLGKRCLVVNLPGPLGWLQAAIMGWVPGRPLSLDNYRSLKLDSVCSESGLARLGIAPTSLQAIVPQYLGGGRREAQLDAFRRAAQGRGAGA